MLVMATALSSCDGWIDNAKTPNNMLTTEQITTPSMLATIRTENIKDGAMIANVKTLAGVAASAAFLTSGAMTDEVEPTAKPNFLTKVSHPLKRSLFSFAFACGPPYPLSFNTWLIEVMQSVHVLHPIFPMFPPLQGF